MKWLAAGLLGLGCLLAAGQADAHFALNFPQGRSNSIEKSPCGPDGSSRGGTVTSFKPGEKIKIKWEIQVEHIMPGRWRVSVDDAGQDFPLPVAAGDTSKLPLFMDNVEVTGLGMHELEITLPDMACDKCTLQLLQYKLPEPPYDNQDAFYYQCADITLDPNAPAGGGMMETGGTSTSNPPEPTAGTSTTGSGGSSSGGAKKDDDGGCSIVAPSSSGGAALVFLGAALVTLGRRRRARASNR